MSGLETPLVSVIEAKEAAAFKRAFNITTVGELLRHYPRRYYTRGQLTPLAEVELDTHVTVLARVQSVNSRQMSGKSGTISTVRVSDGKDELHIVFFNLRPQYTRLQPGKLALFSGKVSFSRGKLQLSHPEFQVLEEADASQTLQHSDSSPGVKDPHSSVELPGGAVRVAQWASRPVAVYPATSRLSSWRIAAIISRVLRGFNAPEYPLPAQVVRDYNLLSFGEALRQVHVPDSLELAERAQADLRFRECLELQLFLLRRRNSVGGACAVARPVDSDVDGLLRCFDEQLPFALTAGQLKVVAEISEDLSRAHPMNRLLQGEVGSGKTVVALRAMVQVAASGGQAVLVAPTEVLAEQHFRVVCGLLGDELCEVLRPVLLTGSLSRSVMRRVLLDVAAGVSRIVVGTHAVFAERVSFFDLGLVVIDEQHRFGVAQRASLLERGGVRAHALALSATPIPRTVALTVFGDLDVSVLREVPAGRVGVRSFVVAELEDAALVARVWQRVREEVDAGHGVFVVCPAIEDAGGFGVDGVVAGAGLASVAETVAALRGFGVLAGCRVEELTGRTPADVKQRVLGEFVSGGVDVLVCTSVVEVGVDVARATVMVVRDADCFGVSQLHQLRGRVGRGSLEGLCLFMTRAAPGSVGRERVTAVASTLDGFEIAEADLRLRREGNILGTRQAGRAGVLRLLRLERDGELIVDCRRVAEGLLEGGLHPTLLGLSGVERWGE